MEIDFTKKEYIALLDLIEIAEWIMNSNKSEIPDMTNVYAKLEQKIYSYANKMGCEELIEYDKKLQQFFPTREFDETSPAIDFIDDYDNESFWDDLIERLASRDLENQVGSINFDKMEIEEELIKEAPIREKYEKEFEANGLKNLYLRESNPEGVKVFRLN
ncbi:MAG: hypothetical protein M0Q21_09505 [Ignavibacteriaceae bacterium]|nr:hypothetical protein [Ignavibacteriaceae bacterium]